MIPVIAHSDVDVQLSPWSATLSVLVALLAFTFAALAFRARAKRQNRGLLWVGWAFLLFGLKNVFSAYSVVSGSEDGLPEVPHDVIELVLSCFDLAIMVLLFVPLIFRRRG